MIQPVNNHLLIEPVVHEEFVMSQKETYEEIGTIVAISESLLIDVNSSAKVGDKVYFDAWLAARFPSNDPDKPYWLVKWEDIRAIEHVES